MNIIFLHKELVVPQKLVSIYMYGNDPSVFIVGYIKHIFEDALFLKIVRQDGAYDGYMIININTICQIEYGTHYLKNINISSLNDTFFEISKFQNYLLQDFIKYCQEKQLIIEIGNDDISIIGKVIYGEQDFLVLNKISTEFSCLDGSIIIRIDDIKSISFLGTRQKKYEKGLIH